MPRDQQGQAAEPTKSALHQGRRPWPVRVPAWWSTRLRLGVGHASTVRPAPSTLGVVGDRGSHHEGRSSARSRPATVSLTPPCLDPWLLILGCRLDGAQDQPGHGSPLRRSSARRCPATPALCRHHMEQLRYRRGHPRPPWPGGEHVLAEPQRTPEPPGNRPEAGSTHSRMPPPCCSRVDGPASQTAPSPVKGRWFLPGGGHESSPVMATRVPHWRPSEFSPGQVSGTTPLPVVAWLSRTLSPWVVHRWAWWSSRSTVAVASVLGISSSNPAGCRLLETATLRRS
jgi:hypothetical protein